MAMAVVSAQLNLLGLHPPSRTIDCEKCGRSNVVSAAVSRPRGNYVGRSGYLPLICQASSGGSRRDYQKIVARTQRRRARHVKGVTPSQPDLLNELEKEQNDQAELDSQDFEDDEGYEDEDVDIEDDSDEAPLPSDEAAVLPPGVAKASYVGDKYEPTEGEEKGLGDQIEESVENVANTTGQAADDSSRRLQKSGRKVGDNVDEIRKEGQRSVEDIAGSTGDAADASAKRLQRTGRRVGDNLEEIRKEGESVVREGVEAVDKQSGGALSNIQEGVEEAGNTAQELGDMAQETADVSGKRLRDAGKDVRDNLAEIGEEGGKVVEKGGEAVREQAKQGANQLGKQVQEAEENVERAARTTVRGAQKSADRIQDPIGKAIGASVGAAEAIGKEAFNFGDTLIEAAEQATGMAGSQQPRTTQPNRESKSKEPEEELVGGRYKPAGKEILLNKQGVGKVQSVSSTSPKETKTGEKKSGDRKFQPAGKDVMRKYQGVGQGEERKSEGEGEEEDGGPYTGLTALVAGASGRTGRLIVEKLVAKGVPVRALVRDVYKARNIKQLQGAELVEGDLYKYETIKHALGDSNVVICAIGAQGLPFDLMQTYKTEYEGVLNLVSASKNQGEVKKFVFITTIGVSSFLQVVPLLFWKRQSELFLQRSGLDYTIVRPAGLTGDRGKNDSVELRPADTQFMGAVSRRKVAEVCVSALVSPSASEKVVEVIGGSGRTKRSIEDQFENV